MTGYSYVDSVIHICRIKIFNFSIVFIWINATYIIRVNLTFTVSPTAQQSPAVNPTKQESQQEQLKRYFLECLL